MSNVKRGLWKLVAASLVVSSLPFTAAATQFNNPLSGQTPTGILQNIIIWLLGLAGLLALLALVIGGIRLIIGGLGNEAEISQAKKIITWAIIGIVVIAMAAVIISVVSGNILGIAGVNRFSP